MNPAKREKEENKLHKIPLRITDTTLRDAHQSLWATRMRTEDIINIVDVIDKVGYYSLECWGGATFDVCLRFLRENPWDRLRQIKERAQKTPLQMLLRGQNLVGYKNYADDVVDRFVAMACDNGMDIFRVFDALNDTRNLESAIRAVKKHNGHAQGTLCYTISPVHTIEKFVKYAKEQVDCGVDSLCIKDMAGILSPIQAERLVSALIKAVDVPIQLHCHASSGMATPTYVEGVRAGAGAIDCAVAAMAGFSSQPPVETLIAIFRETHYNANLDMKAIERVNKYFTELAPKRRLDNGVYQIIDPNILIHQIPGGMISNFRAQLEKQKALDKLPEVLEEVSAVRKDLGYPPLVTPTSQIVGSQAVFNILSGERYKIVPNEVKEYVRGSYGRPPAAIDAALAKKIMGDEKPITHRPADDLKPMLPNATENADPKLILNEEDILSYILLPEPATEYFKYRALPVDQRGPTPADIELQKIREAASASAATTAPKVVTEIPRNLLSAEDYKGLSDIMSRLGGVALDELMIRKGDFSIAIRTGNAKPGLGNDFPTVQNAPAASSAAVPTAAADESVAQPSAVVAEKTYEHTINAPLVGTFYSTSGQGKPKLCNEGDTVKAGDKVCIVEAMKLFNEIEAPYNCRIIKILAVDGQAVDKGMPIIAVEKI